MQNNFAVMGGVMYLSDDGSGIFRNCTITLNYALKGSVLYLFNSLLNMQLEGGEVTQNGFTYSSVDASVFLTDSYSSLFNPTFSSFLNLTLPSFAREVQQSASKSNYQIEMVMASLIINGNTTFTQ